MNLKRSTKSNKKLSNMKGVHNPFREIPFKTHETEYGLVLKNFGHCHFAIYCTDRKNRLGVVRGSLRKSVWIKEGDLVLVGLRDYQDNKCDITLRYSLQEIRQLWSMKEIPDEFYSKIRNLYPSANKGEDSSDLDIVFVDNDDECGDLTDGTSERSFTAAGLSSQSQSFTFVDNDISSEMMSNFDMMSIQSTDKGQTDADHEGSVSDFELCDI